MTGWWLAVALAQDAIRFEALTTVAEGATPSVTFVAQVEGRLTVELQCAGRRYSLGEAVIPGGRYPLLLPGLVRGEHACGGQVRIDEPSGAWGEMPLMFRVVVQPELGWTYGLDDVDLPGKALVVHPTRPLAAATLTVIGRGGRTLDTVTGDLGDPANPRFVWTTSDEVLKLRVEGTDRDGMAGFLELSPWSYAVPHEDVIFASGSHALVDGELPKLERCWAEVQKVLDTYGDVVEIALFVGGYTDTVGEAAANDALSERRARTIAAWFRDRGFRGDVRYQGFGEQALAVPTPDETDAAPNRRAVYLLAAEAPPVSAELPRRAWKPL